MSRLGGEERESHRPVTGGPLNASEYKLTSVGRAPVGSPRTQGWPDAAEVGEGRNARPVYD